MAARQRQVYESRVLLLAGELTCQDLAMLASAMQKLRWSDEEMVAAV